LKLYLKNYLKFKATVSLIFKGDENALIENKNIYTPVQLFKYKMTDEENSIWEQFKDAIINACNELKLPEEYFYYVNVVLDSNWDQSCGYKKHCGFYSVYCDRGNYSISDKIPESDYDKAKFHFLKNIIWNIGNRIECSSRKILKEEWKGKADYDSRKYSFEYAIIMLNKIFNKEYMDELVKEKTEYMNRWFYFDHLGRDKDEWYPAIWKLNESTLRVSSFICITFDISINSREVVNEIFTK